jgi:hypothetical protein
MQLTKEMITARKEKLVRQHEKLQADLNAVTGALQDCVFWETVLAQPEPDAESPKA